MDFIVLLARVFFFYVLIMIAVTVSVLFDANADETTIVKMIRAEAKQNGIDPALAVAIAQTESRLNPSVIGTQGELGVFQLKPQFHGEGVRDTQKNIKVAMKYLVEVKAKCEPKYKDAWIICYNLGPNYSKTIRFPHKFPYYKRVMQNVASN